MKTISHEGPAKKAGGRHDTAIRGTLGVADPLSQPAIPSVGGENPLDRRKIKRATNKVLGLTHPTHKHRKAINKRDIRHNLSCMLGVSSYEGTALKELSTHFDYSVDVGDGHMNVNVQGDGEKAVVLLSGRGTTAPSLDFAPLINQLRGSVTVVTVDYFGYGLSDMTDKPRTIEQITEEIHEALSKLGFSRYSIVAHSIGGIYALNYANIYADELEAFIGIDTTTPKMDQYITPDIIKQTTPPKLKTLLGKISDITRAKRLASIIIPSIALDDMGKIKDYKYSKNEIARWRGIHLRNKDNDDIFEKTKKTRIGPKQPNPTDDMKFPGYIPTKFYLSSESVGIAGWYEQEHQKQLTGAVGSEVIVLRGGHYLHHNQSPTIARGIKRIISVA